MIAERDGDNADADQPGSFLSARMIGFGQHESRGIKAGVVVDLARAEDAVRKAIARAEEMAGQQIDDIVIAVSCGRISSANFSASTDVVGQAVSDQDIARVFRAARDFSTADGRTLLHLNSLGFGLDGNDGIAEPRGMTGRQLSADMHAVTADDLPLRNLTALIDRCYLKVSRLVAGPYASALSSITDEEARLGVLCVDIGGGTTSMAVFAEGHFIHADAIAVGGSHITFDIARKLSTPIEEAERIKTLYGNLTLAGSDAHEVISYPVMDQDEVGLYQISRAELHELIQPRVEQILRLVKSRLDESGMAPFTSDSLVLTGGGSLLAGLQNFAERTLDMHARIGTPQTFADVTETLESPAYAVAHGLVRAAAPTQRVGASDSTAPKNTQSYLGQMSRWLRRSLWDDEQDKQATGT